MPPSGDGSSATQASRIRIIPIPSAEERAEDGEDLARRDLFLQARQDVGRLQSALSEELLHQLVFALRDHLDQLLVLRLGPLGEIRRNRPVHALAVLVDVSLHADEVDRAAEDLLLSDRDLERDDSSAELLAERLDDPVEGGTLPIHAIDDEEDGAAEFLCELPGFLGLDLHAGDGVADDQRGVRGGDGGARLGSEDPVSGSVQEVDLERRDGPRGHRRD